MRSASHDDRRNARKIAEKQVHAAELRQFALGPPLAPKPAVIGWLTWFLWSSALFDSTIVGDLHAGPSNPSPNHSRPPLSVARTVRCSRHRLSQQRLSASNRILHIPQSPMGQFFSAISLQFCTVPWQNVQRYFIPVSTGPLHYCRLCSSIFRKFLICHFKATNFLLYLTTMSPSDHPPSSTPT